MHLFRKSQWVNTLVYKAKLALSPKPSLKNLADHISELAKEQTFINHYFSIRHQFSLIVNQSPVAKQGNHFWQFTTLAFAHEIIIRLSRLFDRQFLDEDKKIYSVRAFLLEIRRSHQLISREHYVGAANLAEWIKKNPGRVFSEGEAPDFHRFNNEFDEIVGKDKQYLSKAYVDKDLKLLRKAMKSLNTYRNKTLAHNAVVKGTEPVTFGEITEAVDTMNKLISKYHLLIKRGSHTLKLPDPDITKLFLVPWIADKAASDAIIADFKKWIKEQIKKV